ncbi:hypothetical protein CAAN1_22S00100 [[Candida] anglica]|uniref:Uncharacterized protein n=1 Tax=[Candida] anglica TaxID=148631 RepID=A0ABP0EKX1_9ASCO
MGIFISAARLSLHKNIYTLFNFLDSEIVLRNDSSSHAYQYVSTVIHHRSSKLGNRP